jgi:cysteinyl-tRNA synthetase
MEGRRISNPKNNSSAKIQLGSILTFKIFNTLTRKKEIFRPLKNREVRMYTCGPTVYDYAHIGNFRTYVWQDLLRRWLKFKGFKVKQVMNLTDVDDKTIKGSRAEGIPLQKFTEKYTKFFLEDAKALNIEMPEVLTPATKHIKEMVELVKKLLEKGYAYKAEDGIYFDISKFKDYGKLSKLKISELKAGARVRVDSYDKEQAQDFALWKFWDPEDGEVFWETEIGKGRPGWHLECSVMSMKYLGKSFDIHTGGVDLIFPHHENEIAQSESTTGKQFVKYWIHGEHLLVEGRKMSKSLGNFITVHELLEKGYDPMAIRYLLLSTHYRQQLNFTYPALQAAKNAVERFYEFMRRLYDAKGKRNNPDVDLLIKHALKAFEDKMDDDLKINEALAEIFEFMTAVNRLLDQNAISKKDAEKVRAFMLTIDKVLGLKLDKVKKEKLPKEVAKLIKEREKARKAGDFATADKIRNEIKERYGIIIEDLPKGVKWKRL